MTTACVIPPDSAVGETAARERSFHIKFECTELALFMVTHHGEEFPCCAIHAEVWSTFFPNPNTVIEYLEHVIDEVPV